jgi:hypothetical protein
MAASEPDPALIHAEYTRLTAAEAAEVRRHTSRVSSFVIVCAVLIPALGILIGGQVTVGGEALHLTWAVWLLAIPAAVLGFTTFASLAHARTEADLIEEAKQGLRDALRRRTGDTGWAPLLAGLFATHRSHHREFGRLAIVTMACTTIIVSLATVSVFTDTASIPVAGAIMLALHLVWWFSSQPGKLPPEWRPYLEDPVPAQP